MNTQVAVKTREFSIEEIYFFMAIQTIRETHPVEVQRVRCFIGEYIPNQSDKKYRAVIAGQIAVQYYQRTGQQGGGGICRDIRKGKMSLEGIIRKYGPSVTLRQPIPAWYGESSSQPGHRYL